jgi:hypothetical protein
MEVKENSNTKEITFHPLKNPVSNQINNSSSPTPTPTPVPPTSQPENQNNQINTEFNNIEIDADEILNSLNDQKAIRDLQKILMKLSNEQVKSIANGLQGKYEKLIRDKNGNYFCKDLFKICGLTERLNILKELSPTLSIDCCDKCATHPLQTLIEYTSTQEEYDLILYSFNDYNKFLFATLDRNGAYVVQRIITKIPEKFRNQFNDTFVSFIPYISKQKYGIVSVKKFIEYTKSEEITQDIMNLIRNNFMDLAIDKFGNYLFPFLLDKWSNSKEVEEIKNLIINHKDILSEAQIPPETRQLYNKLWENNVTEKKDSTKMDEQPKENNQSMIFQKMNESIGINP